MLYSPLRTEVCGFKGQRAHEWEKGASCFEAIGWIKPACNLTWWWTHLCVQPKGSFHTYIYIYTLHFGCKIAEVWDRLSVNLLLQLYFLFVYKNIATGEWELGLSLLEIIFQRASPESGICLPWETSSSTCSWLLHSCCVPWLKQASTWHNHNTKQNKNISKPIWTANEWI